MHVTNKSGGLWHIVLSISAILLIVYAMPTNTFGEEPQVEITGKVPDFTAISKTLFDHLDAKGISTGILYDRQLAPFVEMEKFNGDTLTHDTVNASAWRQVYTEMYNSCIGTPQMPALAEINAGISSAISQGKVPLRVFFAAYNQIKPDAVEKSLLKLDGDHFVEGANKAETPYDEKCVFVSSVMRDGYTGGLTVTFDLSCYASQPGISYLMLKIDFGDGQGYRDVLGLTSITITYPCYGQKTISTIGLIMRPGGGFPGGPIISFFYSTTKLWVLDRLSPDFQCQRVSSRPWAGQAAGYQVCGIYGTGNSTIKKPIIIVEGFDPKNENNFPEIYWRLCQQNLVDRVRDLGYDVLFMNFSNGGDYIQRNALALVDMIEWVNATKTTNEPLVVVGASMGGLVSRYALMYMENNNLPHQTRLFVSFDSPQQGANVPLGDQFWLNFFSGRSQAAAEAITLLNTPAAKQMLVYNYSSSLRPAFYNELSQMGDYPHGPRLRKVAIANGNGTSLAQMGCSNRMQPGSLIVNYFYESWKVDITGYSWAVPNGAYWQPIFYGKIDIIGPSYQDQLIRVYGTMPYDNAPGGWRNTQGVIAAGNPGYGCITSQYPNHSFIPSVSALDLRQASGVPIGLFDPILGVPYATPFDQVFCEASENNDHVTVTPAIANYLIEQLNYVPDNLALQNIFLSGVEPPYQARYTITAAGLDGNSNPTYFTVASTGTAIFEAGSQVKWGAGFHAYAGSTVKAGIKAFPLSAPMAGQGNTLVQMQVSTGPAKDDSKAGQQKQDGELPLPRATEIRPNHPNPFSGLTCFSYSLAATNRVNMQVYNTLGQRVRTLVNDQRPAGYHSVTWDGRNDQGKTVSRGVYLCRFTAGDYSKSYKMILVK